MEMRENERERALFFSGMDNQRRRRRPIEILCSAKENGVEREREKAVQTLESGRATSECLITSLSLLPSDHCHNGLSGVSLNGANDL